MVLSIDTIVGIAAGCIIAVLGWFANRLVSQIDTEITELQADNRGLHSRFHTLSNQLNITSGKLEIWEKNFLPERKQ